MCHTEVTRVLVKLPSRDRHDNPRPPEFVFTGGENKASDAYGMWKTSTRQREEVFSILSSMTRGDVTEKLD